MMDFQWWPSVETVLWYISTFNWEHLWTSGVFDLLFNCPALNDCWNNVTNDMALFFKFQISFETQCGTRKGNTNTKVLNLQIQIRNHVYLWSLSLDWWRSPRVQHSIRYSLLSWQNQTLVSIRSKFLKNTLHLLLAHGCHGVQHAKRST